MTGLAKLLDRTAVLFIGIGVGATIAAAFAQGDASGSRAAGDPPRATMAAARSCPTGVQLAPHLMRTIRQGKNIEIGVFGDSFGEGIWAGLYNDLRDDPDFVVHRFSKQSTGFTRYSSLNLLDDARQKIAAQPVDIAVINFGANDTQDIYDQGRLMPYMSPDWQRVVGERVKAYVELFRSQGASVVWVGLPRMRKPSFDGQIQQMNRFYADLMCDLKVPFIDTLPKSIDRQGAYSEYLKPADGGEPVKARAADGIHMSMTGYRILIADMTANIRQFDPPSSQGGSATLR
ncbi:MAG: GDSL-type esterase/lipase family protein [Novosphingobium sp.]